MNLDELGVHDLIYDDGVLADAKKRFPSVKVTDASDCIHERRVEVDIADASRRDWYAFLLDSGAFQVSFEFQLNLLRSDPDFDALVKDWIEHHPAPEATP